MGYGIYKILKGKQGNSDMEYAEYKAILDEALCDYVNRGGSVFYMSCVKKEYIFSYEDEKDNCPMAYDTKKHLSNKAIQAIMKKEKLPKGIRLEKVIYHGKD